MKSNGVRALLMGGQACVLYGAAEFSRNIDFAILADGANLERLRMALAELEAEVVAIPEFRFEYLERGHAVPFRCRHEEALGMRVDVMTRMRGVAGFAELWERRRTIEWDGLLVDVMSLADLVNAKKTQRDKDWPMIRRLVERAYYEFQGGIDEEVVPFLFRELRTAELLIEFSKEHRATAEALSRERPLLVSALNGDVAGLEGALELEEKLERGLDREYWKPLREELERLRKERRSALPG